MSLKKLRPVETLTQVDKIELSLEEYFRTENFGPGDSIPKEVDLAHAMGVSRTAIREAISRFRMLGIIESRKNRGMVITRPDVLNNMERVLDPKLLDGDTMREIFEMRLIIEMGLGDFLFMKKNEENLAKLEDIVTKEEHTDNRIERLKYDVEFHSMLYNITGNKTVMRFQKMLLPIFDYVDSGLNPGHIKKEEIHITHRDLLEELRNGSPEVFRNKMHNHLLYYFQKL